MAVDAKMFLVKRTGQRLVLNGIYDQGTDTVYVPISGALLTRMAGDGYVIRKVDGPAALGAGGPVVIGLDPIVLSGNPDSPKAITITFDEIEVPDAHS